MKKKKNSNKNNVKRKINYQRVFCALSIGIVIGCIVFYGTRFVSLYLDNKKEDTSNTTLGYTVKKNNISSDSFKNINGTYYFNGNKVNNYVKYSNITWRIVKVNADSLVTLVSDSVLTSLAIGKDVDYEESYIYKWLNSGDSKYSGILEGVLNDTDKYLSNTVVCTDVVDKTNSSSCENEFNDGLIGIIDVNDYLNTGADEGFMATDEAFYLSNKNSDDKLWYVNSCNKLANSDGEDLFGVKAVITIKSDVNIVSGDGSSDKPYKIEKENGMFGSYVDLDGDIWRVYAFDDETVSLVLDSPLDEEMIYASSGYKFDDTVKGSVGYYLNTTYLNSLTYKSIINENVYSNGYYGSDNDYNYMDTLSGKIRTKVAIPTIGDIYLSNSMDYMIMIGKLKSGNLIYITGDDGELYSDNSKNENLVLPVININKDLLISGDGTFEKPFTRE